MYQELDDITPKEAASLLNVSVSIIRQWVEKGDLNALITAGGHRRFKMEDIEKFARDKDIDLKISNKNKLKILIVDDEPLFADLLQTILETESKNVVVKISLDGFDAGLKLRDFSPDVVLLDLMMPGFDGFRVCKQIKKDPLYRHIRVITISGDASEQNRKRVIDAGAEGCLAKPIDIVELLKLLKLKREIS